MTKAELISLLRQADESDLGVVVRTNDAERLRQRLYPEIKQGGYALRVETFRNGELRLVKKV